MAFSIPDRCARCGEVLLAEDVNLAQDVARCRVCGYTGPFLGAGQIPKLTDEELAHPPKRVSLQRGFGDTLTIVCHPKRTALWFLVPFTAIWSGVSLAGIYGQQLIQGQFDWKLSLFGLPFLAGTVGLAGAILYNFFGRTRVMLSKGRVKVFMGVWGLGRTREMVYGREATVSLRTSDFRANNVPQQEIVLASGGEEIKFGAMGLSGEAKKYVAAVLRRVAGGR